ncbi:MAG: hypothetical protein IT553_09110 [Sphingomonadaceae bacterium]|nr:hypothetical protein [Sphingomonadaceae bacterium]
MSEVDETIARARAAIERSRTRDAGPMLRRTTSRAEAERAKRFILLLGAGFAAIIGLVIFWSMVIGPVKAMGILLLLIAAAAVFFGSGILARGRPITLPQMQSGTLAAITDNSERWLMQQRRLLPPPARTLGDQIGARIAALQPMLANISDDTHEARELKRILGDELPDLVGRYQAVPANLRRTDRNGRVPEQDLVDGLGLIDQQIDNLSRGLGAVEMDKLSSQKRYLELRYQDDEQE